MRCQDKGRAAMIEDALTSSVESEVLFMLARADRSYRYSDGRVRWLLDADDVLYLLELGGADTATVERVSALVTDPREPQAV
jgi:hypothetical protein